MERSSLAKTRSPNDPTRSGGSVPLLAAIGGDAEDAVGEPFGLAGGGLRAGAAAGRTPLAAVLGGRADDALDPAYALGGACTAAYRRHPHTFTPGRERANRPVTP